MTAYLIPLVPATMPLPHRITGDLPYTGDPARLRFARAADVRPGDLIVGRIDNLNGVHYVEFADTALTADPTALDPAHCEFCVLYVDEPYLNLVPCHPETVHHLTVWKPAEWAVIVPKARRESTPQDGACKCRAVTRENHLNAVAAGYPDHAYRGWVQ